MLIENKNIEDLLEYLNPMSESALDKLLSDTPQLLEDCVSYFSNKIVSENLKHREVKDYLSGRVSNPYLEKKLWDEIEKSIYPYLSAVYLRNLINSRLEEVFFILENKAILEIGSEHENLILVENLNMNTKVVFIKTVATIHMINNMIIINRFSKRKFTEVAKKVFGFDKDTSGVIWYCCDKMRNELERFYLLKATANLNKISNTIDAMYDIVDDFS